MNNIDFIAALPQSLRQDETIASLASILQSQFVDISNDIKLNLIYARIDTLNESLLDILAYDFHVDWYDYDVDVAAKRKAIKSCVPIHKRLGTVYAVKKALQTFSINSDIQEWYEYNGSPYTFRVNVSLNKFLADNQNLFGDIIKQVYTVKNVRSHIDSVSISYPEISTKVSVTPVYMSTAETKIGEFEYNYSHNIRLKAVANHLSVSETLLGEYDKIRGGLVDESDSHITAENGDILII